MFTIKKEEEYLEFCMQYSDYTAKVRAKQLELIKLRYPNHHPTPTQLHLLTYEAERLSK
jgi:hypothetical protein